MVEADGKKAPNIFFMSFGGLNSLGILTASISVLRLITAHTSITLHGIIKDVVDWYKKFFHQSIDTFVDWVNAFHINWLHLPHMPDSVKDLIILLWLFGLVTYRSLGLWSVKESYHNNRKISRAITIGVAIISPIFVYPIFNEFIPLFYKVFQIDDILFRSIHSEFALYVFISATYVFFIITIISTYIYSAISFFVLLSDLIPNRNKERMSSDAERRYLMYRYSPLAYLTLLQFVTITIAVASMLVISAYS